MAELERPTPRQAQTSPSCSLYVIQAADGRSAVVFRRGPSKRVMIARWCLMTDQVEHGHWFAGRIYERYSDLSPNGELLLYFAARHKGELPTWTGVSRVPYLTALVLWTCYVNGGGFFETDRSVVLDEFVSKVPLRNQDRNLLIYPEEDLRRHLTTRHMTKSDDLRRYYCVEHARLARDGWRCTKDGGRVLDERWVLQPTLVEPQI
jgi:hypothetical protein